MAPRARRIRDDLSLLPPESAIKAIRAVEDGRVISIRVDGEDTGVRLVRGEEGTYLVLSGSFCSCPDFYVRVLSRSERPLCYHLAAVRVAESEGSLRRIDLSRGRLMELICRLLFSES